MTIKAQHLDRRSRLWTVLDDGRVLVDAIDLGVHLPEGPYLPALMAAADEDPARYFKHVERRKGRQKIIIRS